MGKLFNLDISKLKTYGAAIVTSSKKNAPTIMTAGSIILGWTGVYIFWRQSKKAEQKIMSEEAFLNKDKDSDTPIEELDTLSKKEKFFIYLQYCWMALIFGIGSTGLAIWSDKESLKRLMEMAALAKFMNNKSDKQEDLIKKLKAEVGDKRFEEMQDEILEEEFPRDEVMKAVMAAPADGKTLFIDEHTGVKFRADIMEVRNGLAEFNNRLKSKYEKALKRTIGDAFYASDNPYKSKVFSSLDLEVFLQCIGELDRDEIPMDADILEFRYYGDDVVEPVAWNDIARYKEYVDPSTGFPHVCYLRYRPLLRATNELLDRD